MSFRRSPRAILSVLTGLNLVNYLDRYMTGAVLPLIAAEFHISGFKSGLPAAFFMIVYVMVSPVAGWLADHRARLRLAAVGVLIWSVATVTSGLAPVFTALLVARAISGFGEATYAVVTPSLLADSYPPERRGSALSIFFAALPVGTALAYGLGGWVGPKFGWRVSYMIVFVPALVMCVMLWLLEEPQRGRYDGGIPLKEMSLKAALRALAARRSYVYNTAAQTIFTFTLGGMAYWVPTFLLEERQIPLEVANPRFGVVLLISGIIGNVAGGQIGDALARRFRGAHFTFSAVATLLAVPFICVAILSRNQWVIWPCTFIGLFMLFLITGPLQGSMMNVLPPNLRGRGVAIYTVAIHVLGDALSPPLLGRAKDSFGLEVPLLCAVIFLSLAGWLLLAGRKALIRDLESVQEEITSASLAEQGQILR